jgi:DNA repair protein SbcD/Mre11
MKFIHAADLHIDSALDGLSAHPDAPVERLRTATRAAFSALIDRAIEEKVAFVVIPGDLYDGDWNDWNTGHFFNREMLRLKAEGIAAVVLRGNHDAENEMTRKLPMPDNVRVFGSARPETIRLACDGVEVALHGQSFRRMAVTENLVPGYPAPLPGHLNIGVLHTALEGYAAHASYAPCTLDELKNKGYDYWALGHVHEHAILCEAPWIAFSGNLQGRHIREPGARGALLVTYEDGEVKRPERILVDVVRWAVAAVDIGAATTREEAVALVGAEFRRLVDHDAGGRPLACRVILTGRSAAHGALFGQERALRADLIAQAQIAAGDDLWVEKIKVQSEPALDAETVAGRGDAVAFLQSLFGDAAQDAGFLKELAAEFAPLLGKMPHDLYAQDVPALKAVQQADYATLVAQVAPSVLDRVDRMTKEG